MKPLSDKVSSRYVLIIFVFLGLVYLVGSSGLHASAGESPRSIDRLGSKISTTPAAPAPTYKTYFPLLYKFTLPPMVTLDAVTINDGNGIPKSTFLPGAPIRYSASGTNPNTVPATVAIHWTHQSSCGQTTVMSNTLTVQPGSWSYSASSVAPACSDLYLNNVEVTNSYLTASLQTLFAVNLPSQAAYENRQGFDRCYLPSIADMQSWWDHSPYWVFNIYLGGSMFYCQDDIPDPYWVHIVSSQGWKFILTWVGPQAPCSSFRDKMSADAGIAYQEGRAEAASAATAAARIGFMGGGVIYYDLEAYSSNASAECRATVKSFIKGWTERLHDYGFFAGGYGSPVTSYIGDWASNNPPPDYIWIAHYVLPYQYDANATVWSKFLSNSLWANHQRIRQYAGGHNETWGGTALVVDSNALDGVVTRIPTTTLTATYQPDVGLAPAPLIRAAERLSPEAGWALRGESLLVTSDDGQNWQDIAPNLPAGTSVLNAAFLDSQHAWLVIQSGADKEGGTIQVLRTGDGGATWESFALNLAQSSIDQGMVQAAFLDIINPSTSWLSLRLASGSSFSLGRLFFTQDGGRTWEERSLPLGEPVRFQDAQRGWIAGGPGGDQLYQTQDGGLTWQRQAIALPAGLVPRRVLFGLPGFSSTGNGILPITVTTASGAELLVYERSAEGKDWQLSSRQALTGKSPPSAALPFNVLPTGGWLATLPSSQLYSLTPGGGAASLRPAASLPADLVTMNFTNPQEGWALVQDGDCLGQKSSSETNATLFCEQNSRLLSTSDGGQTWSLILR